MVVPPRCEQRGGMLSLGDIRDTSLGFPIVFDLHLDGKMDSAACSEIISRSSRVTFYHQDAGPKY